MAGPSKRPGRFLAGAALLFGVWVTLGSIAVAADDFPRTGPLALDQPELTEPPGPMSLSEIKAHCFPDTGVGGRIKVVGGLVDGRQLYACYRLDANGAVTEPAVIDADGARIDDIALIKRAGAWRWVGLVTGTDSILGSALVGVLVLALASTAYIGARRPEPGDLPAWARGRRPWRLWLLLAVPVLGWIALLAAGGATRSGRWWYVRLIGLALLVEVSLTEPLAMPSWLAHLPTLVWTTLAPLAALYAVVAGQRWLVAEPEPVAVAPAPALAPPAPPAPQPPAAPGPGPELSAADRAALAELTPRELEVLGQLALGRSNARIAEALFLSETTVKSHVARVLTKLGMDNRVQAALFAQRHGLTAEERTP
jgi:DNA-binding CsgD family transcriptional regulator